LGDRLYPGRSTWEMTLLAKEGDHLDDTLYNIKYRHHEGRRVDYTGY